MGEFGDEVGEVGVGGDDAQFDVGVLQERGAEFGLVAQLAKEVGDAVPGPARQDIIDAATIASLGRQYREWLEGLPPGRVDVAAFLTREMIENERFSRRAGESLAAREAAAVSSPWMTGDSSK